MRSLGASTTSATEGIAIAVMEVWIDEINPLQDVEVVADSCGAHNFTAFHDSSVGHVLIKNSNYWERFVKYLAANTQLDAVYRKSGMGKAFFEQNLATLAGMELKKSKWWKAHLGEMEKAKRDLKKVRKVMES